MQDERTRHPCPAQYYFGLREDRRHDDYVVLISLCVPQRREQHVRFCGKHCDYCSDDTEKALPGFGFGEKDAA
jgi:hypothetical protein